MAKIKEIYVEAKNSWNFQTYTTGILAEVTESGTELNEVIDNLHTVCREKNKERMNIDRAKANVLLEK